MASRFTFGGYGGDQVTQDPAGNSGIFKAASNYNSVGTFWSAQTGGTQYTDLVDPNNGFVAITGISTDAHGDIVPFQGPAGVGEGWIDFGRGRFKVIANEGVSAIAALGFTPNWQPNTTYLAGQAVVNPTGDLVTAKVNFTSGSSYSATNWNLSASYAPPLPASPAAFNLPMQNSGNTGLAWTTSQAVVARALGWAIVTDPAYGAKGDGTTDDEPAFLAAHNAAGNGGTVWVPNPTAFYRFASTFVISKDIRLLGSGRSTCIIKADAGVGAIKTDQVGSDVPQNWQIKDFQIVSAAGSGNKLANPVVTLGATATSGGTFGAGTYFWAVSAINAVGETLAETEVSATLVSTGTQVLNWTAITGATGYKVYRGTSSYNYGATALVTTLGTVTTYTDTGTATTTGATLSTATASGSDIGIWARWGPGTIADCDVNYFGSHGIFLDSTSGGTQVDNSRIQTTKCYGNGGDGIRLEGSDANACVLDQPNCVANYGWGIRLKGCSSNQVRKAHADQQYNGAPGAFWDNGITNIWDDIYSEGSKRIRLHPGVSSPWVRIGTYARPVVENPNGGGVVIDTETGFNTWLRVWNGTDSYSLDSAASALSAWTLKYTGTHYTAKTVHSYYRVFDQWWWNTHLVGFSDATWDLGVSGNRWRNMVLSGSATIPVLIRTPVAQTLSSAGAVTIAAGSGDATITLQANATSSTITGAVAGQQLRVTWIQDATGGRTYVWPANCKFAGGAAPADTTASKQSTVTFRYDGTNWQELSRAVAVG